MMLAGCGMLLVAALGLSPIGRSTRIALAPERALPPGFNGGTSALRSMLRLVFAAEADNELLSHELLSHESLGALRASLTTAGFRPLTDRDVTLSRALNAGYLLRLSIAPQLDALPTLGDGEAAIYDDRVLIYVRNHGVEVTNGMLWAPKFAYLQARWLSWLLSPMARALSDTEEWIDRSVRAVSIKLRVSYKRLRRRVLPFGSARQSLGKSRRIATQVSEAILASGTKVILRKGRDTLYRYSGGFVSFSDDSPLAPFVLTPTTDGCNVSAPSVERVAIADLFAWKGRRLGVGSVLPRVAGFARTLISPCELVEPTFGEVAIVWRGTPTRANGRTPEKSPSPSAPLEVCLAGVTCRDVPCRAVP